jgi:PAS domain S-box-containing protein
MQTVHPIDLVETIPEGLLLVSGDFVVQFANRSYYRMFNVSEAATVGQSLFGLGEAQWDIPGLRERLADVLHGQSSIEGYEVERPFPGIGERIMHLYARRVRRGLNETGHLLIILDDVTEAVRAERALERERILARGVVDTIHDPLLVLDGHLHVVTASRSFHMAFGTNEKTVIGRPLGRIGRGEWNIRELHDLLQQVLTDNAVIEAREIQVDLSGRQVRRIEFSARETVIQGSDGRTVLLVIKDVTERRQLEESQRLLIDELNHRVRNMLTVVKSLAAQTRRRSTSLEAFGEAFDGRLQALASIHTLLADSKWAGSTFATVIRRQVQPYAASAGAFSLSGPDLTVAPRSAVTLTLVFHELAVNAAKYGSLSRQTGRVEVVWTVADSDGERTVTVDWIESGGPPVQPPSRLGFGTDLIDFNIVHEFGGEVQREFRADGLRCRLTIPWPEFATRAQTLPSASISSAASSR